MSKFSYILNKWIKIFSYFIITNLLRLLHKKTLFFLFLFFFQLFISLSPIANFSLSFPHRISSFRRRHRPTKHPARSTDLGLLISDLERSRTAPEASESAPDSHVCLAISPPFWLSRRSGDLPPARPCSIASPSGQIEVERRCCRTPSAGTKFELEFAPIVVVALLPDLRSLKLPPVSSIGAESSLKLS